MIDYIQIRVTPGHFEPKTTQRELEIRVKTWEKEYLVRQIYPEDWFESDFDRIMDAATEKLKSHIKDSKSTESKYVNKSIGAMQPGEGK